MPLVQKSYVFAGAGLASLSCINKLVKNSNNKVEKHDILVLEAASYKGGRMKTSERYDIELGASWLHDSLDNQVLNYLIEEDLITFENPNTKDMSESKKIFGCFDDNVKMLLFEGKCYTNDVKLRLEILLAEFEKFVENFFFQDENLHQDPSLKWLFLKYINERRVFFRTSDKKQLQLLSLFVRYVETWHGISWEHLSAKYAFMDNVGQNIMCFGFNKLIDHLSEGIDINYNESVTKVVKNNNHYIINDKYTTENFILGIPQSCFKDITFSNNLINSELKDSYEKIHYGALGKIIIEFEDDFDYENTRLYHMGTILEGDKNLIAAALTDCGLANITTDSLMSSEDSERKVTFNNIFDWPMLVVNHQSIINKPVLLVLTQNPVTAFIEENFSKRPLNIIPYLKPLLDNIGTLLYDKKEKLAKIKHVMVSEWSQSKYQKGSYPACYPGDSPMDVTIQTSLQNEVSQLKIIGEYTNLEGCGSINGAWLSGVECAEKILQDMQ